MKAVSWGGVFFPSKQATRAGCTMNLLLHISYTQWAIWTWVLLLVLQPIHRFSTGRIGPSPELTSVHSLNSSFRAGELNRTGLTFFSVPKLKNMLKSFLDKTLPKYTSLTPCGILEMSQYITVWLQVTHKIVILLGSLTVTAGWCTALPTFFSEIQIYYQYLM